MKKRILKIFAAALLTAAVVISAVMPGPVQAASTKTRIKKLIKNMRSYEYAQIVDLELTVGEGYKIVLDKKQMARASALALSLKKVYEDKGDTEGYILYSVSSSKLKKMSKKLFGVKVTTKNLPKENDYVHNFIDAYLTKDNKPVVYVWQWENEDDLEERKIEITETKSGYKVVKRLYCGYWGLNDKKSSNYKITYNVVANKASSYGYVIKDMQIEKTGN